MGVNISQNLDRHRTADQKQEAYPVELPEVKRMEELNSVYKTLATAFRTLHAHGVLLTRKQWLKEAEQCEAEGAPRKCEAIVSATVVGKCIHSGS